MVVTKARSVGAPRDRRKNNPISKMEQNQCSGSGVIPQVLRKDFLGQMARMGLSQRAASVQIGVSHSALSTWLSGTYKGSVESVGRSLRRLLG